MNDHNLDDLIIDTTEPKNGKTKGALTIMALLIVVVIIGIVVFRIVADGTSTDHNPYGENTSLDNDDEMVEPELRLAHVSKKKEEKTPQVTEMINDKEEESPKAEPKLNKIIEEELNKPVSGKKPEAPVIIKEKTVEPVVITAVEPEKETVDIDSEVEQKPEVVNAPVVEKTPVPIPVTEAPVKEEKVVKQEPVAKPVTVKSTATINYYIQVGAYSQKPSKRFLQHIKNSGFNYKITSPSAKGIKKLFIGPYTDKISADNALVRVRDLINKSAFVVKR